MGCEIDTDEVEEMLGSAIRIAADSTFSPFPGDARVRVRTFAAEGVLTTDNGLLLRIGDREFQITIVRSR